MSLDVGGATNRFQVAPRFAAQANAVRPAIKMEPATDEVNIRFAGKKERDWTTTAIKGGAAVGTASVPAILLYQPAMNLANWLTSLAGYAPEATPTLVNVLAAGEVGAIGAVTVGAGAKVVKHRHTIWEHIKAPFLRRSVDEATIRKQATAELLATLEDAGIDVSALQKKGGGGESGNAKSGGRRRTRQTQESSEGRQEGKSSRVESDDETLVVKE